MFIPPVLERLQRSRDNNEVIALWKVYQVSNGNPSLFDVDAVLRAKVAKALISQGKLTLTKEKGLVYAY